MAQALPEADQLLCGDPKLSAWAKDLARRAERAEARDLRRAADLVTAVPGVPVARVSALPEEPASLADLRLIAGQLQEVL
jgi:hypothetical protein